MNSPLKRLLVGMAIGTSLALGFTVAGPGAAQAASAGQCFTLYEHTNYNRDQQGQTHTSCASIGGSGSCFNILGAMDNNASSLTHNGASVYLYDASSCGGNYMLYTSQSQEPNLHGFNAGDRTSSVYIACRGGVC